MLPFTNVTPIKKVATTTVVATSLLSFCVIPSATAQTSTTSSSTPSSTSKTTSAAPTSANPGGTGNTGGSTGNNNGSILNVQGTNGLGAGRDYQVYDADGRLLASGSLDNHSNAKIPFTPDGKDKLQRFDFRIKDDGKLSIRAGQCTGQGTNPSDSHLNYDKDAQAKKDKAKKAAQTASTSAGVPIAPIASAIQSNDIKSMPALMTIVNGGTLEAPDTFDGVINRLGGEDAVQSLLASVGSSADISSIDNIQTLASELNIAPNDARLENADILMPMVDEANQRIKEAQDKGIPMEKAFPNGYADLFTDAEFNRRAQEIADQRGVDKADVVAGFGQATVAAGAGTGAAAAGAAEAFAAAAAAFAQAIGEIANAAGVIAQAVAPALADAFAQAIDYLKRLADSFDELAAYVFPVAYKIIDDIGIVLMQKIGDLRQEVFDIRTMARNIANQIIRQFTKDWGLEFDAGGDGIGFNAQRGDQINCVADFQPAKNVSENPGTSTLPAPGTGNGANTVDNGATADTGGHVESESLWQRFLGLFRN